MSKTILEHQDGKYVYKALIGTGGIGYGSLFLLSGNHTLGREESRGGKYLDARDYCKLHIIAHNVKMLMGIDFPVYPIGKIGNDEIGRSVYAEMGKAGLNMQFVGLSGDDKTLFGFCFIYPDGTGGNLTTEESASTKVDSGYIEIAIPVFSKYIGSFISLSAPEVPLDARKRLLELTKKYNGFGVASFTSGEIVEAEKKGMFDLVDLLAVNVEEAAAFIREDISKNNTELVVRKAIEKMKRFNPDALLSITTGKIGSWSWDGTDLSFVPAFPVEAQSSAGAGDAHLAGIITGLSYGLGLKHSQILGNLMGAFSVTSPHTIHPDLNRKNLEHFAFKFRNRVEPALMEFLAS